MGRNRWAGAVLAALLGTGCAVAEVPGGQSAAPAAPAAASAVAGNNGEVPAPGQAAGPADTSGVSTAAPSGAPAVASPSSGAATVAGAAPTTATTAPRSARAAGAAAPSSAAGPAPAVKNPGGGAAPTPAAGAAAGPDNSDVGVTADTIKVGVILPLSGPIGPYGKPWLEALQTPFRRASDGGGINGRRFDFLFCDDAFQGDRALACAKKLVDQDKVFLIMNPGSAGGSPASLPYIVQRGVPSGSALGFNPEEFTSPLVFPMTASGRTQGHLGARFIARDLQVKKVGMVVLGNVEAATVVASGFREAAAAAGMSVTEVTINFQDADCSAQMVQLQSRAPESVFLASDASTAIKCFTAANNLGYKPPKQFVSPIPQYIDLVPQYGGQAAEGCYVMTVNHTPDTTTGGFIAEYLSRVKAYYPDHRWWAETPAFYAGAQLTVDMLRTLGRNVTRARFVDAMNTVTNGVPGLGVDITYRAGPHDPNRQAAMLQLQHGKFVPVTGFVRDDFGG
ncbi:MAG: ABC transporter substrate-binding protein [Actinobacteria bacterium]|nr:ABC transporter substrate-binding protein [Actinomycetota bacterium]